MKRLMSLAVAVTMTAALFTGCGAGERKPAEDKKEDKPESKIDMVIKEAQTMTMQELAKKAIEESNGKTFYGLGNSSRGKSALPIFIDYLKTIDPDYNMEFEWQQPKNNKIFDQLKSDSEKETGTFAMTLIQDGNQIQSKMVETGILKTFIPKQWAEDNKIDIDGYTGFLPLQTLNKVFMYNDVDGTKFMNCWDFVKKDSHPLFMDIDSEIVGKNFLYMLTEEKYANWLKDAYDALSNEDKEYFKPVVDEMQKKSEEFSLSENGAYALAWIKLWVENYNAQTDDGPICNTLTTKSAAGQSGLLVYSKLRSIEESDEVSVKNVKVAAYQDGYKGIGGYGYCHYLFLTDNSPLPWTACAFIEYMTCMADGFEAWGKDMGGYSGNPEVSKAIEEKFQHSKGGYVDGKNEFDSKNDRGYEWWTTDGELVIEEPVYCSEVSFTIGAWIDSLKKFN